MPTIVEYSGVVAYLDTSALLTIPRLMRRGLTGVKEGHSSAHHEDHFKKTSKTLWRWLGIALIDILLNTPENLLRSVLTAVPQK